MRYISPGRETSASRSLVFYLIGALIGLGLSSGCARAVVDRSLITSDPCGPPCWQGIIPGITTAEEAASYLDESPYVMPGTLRSQELDGKTALISWIAPSSSRGFNSISFCSDRVWTTHIVLDFTLAVDGVIEHFGEPRGVSVSPGNVPEDPDWSVFLDYPDIGIRLEAVVPVVVGELLPSSVVVSVTYYDPSAKTQGDCPLDFKTDASNLWGGYGPVESLYP